MQQLGKASQLAIEALETLCDSNVDGLVKVILRSTCYKALGRWIDAEHAEEQHAATVAEIQLQQLRKTAAESKDASGSESSTQFPSDREPDNNEYRIAYLNTLVSAFYEAIRYGWFKLARKQYNLILELRQNPDLAPKFWPLYDDLWRWKGMVSVLLAAEGHSTVISAFHGFIRELKAARSAVARQRDSIALFAAEDYRLIHGSLAAFILGSSLCQEDNKVHEFAACAIKAQQRISAAHGFIETLKGGALTDSLDSASSTAPIDNRIGEKFQGDIKRLRVLNMNRRMVKVLWDKVDLEEYHLEKILQESSDSSEWDMVIDEVGSLESMTGLAGASLAKSIERITPATLVLDFFYDNQQLLAWSLDSTGIKTFYRREIERFELEGGVPSACSMPCNLCLNLEATGNGS